MGGGQSAEVPHGFWRTPSMFLSQKTLVRGKKKQGPKSLGGKSSRRGSENWGELQRSIFEPRRWETILPPGCGGGETSLAKQ